MTNCTRVRDAALAVLVALALSVGVIGCSGRGPETTPPDAEDSRGNESTSVAPTPAIGLRETGRGEVEAVGFLVYVDLEGGFWALAQTLPGEPATVPELVAVIANPDEAGLPETPAGSASFQVGDLVRVEGALFEGATIRQAGPEVVVRRIEVVTETTAP